jgi:hypothetical protein
MIFIQIPAQWILPDVTTNFRVFLSISNDVFKIIALPDHADRGMLPKVPGYRGLERAHNRWYRSKRRRRKTFPMWGAPPRVHFLDVQNGV